MGLQMDFPRHLAHMERLEEEDDPEQDEEEDPQPKEEDLQPKEKEGGRLDPQLDFGIGKWNHFFLLSWWILRKPRFYSGRGDDRQE